jgi:hypothetical protein
MSSSTSTTEQQQTPQAEVELGHSQTSSFLRTQEPILTLNQPSSALIKNYRNSLDMLAQAVATALAGNVKLHLDTTPDHC